MIWLIPVIPLTGSLVVGLTGRRMPRMLAAVIACGAVALSLMLSVTSFSRLLSLPVEERVLRASLGSWIASGDFTVSFGFLFDPLSAIMALVVCGVGLLIHIRPRSPGGALKAQPDRNQGSSTGQR